MAIDIIQLIKQFLFDMISLLKEVGLSLEEIKIYMDNRDAKTFFIHVKRKRKKNPSRNRTVKKIA